MTTEHRIQWIGGPLDGAEDTKVMLSPWWQGPDPANPMTHTILYQLVWKNSHTPQYHYVETRPTQ